MNLPEKATHIIIDAKATRNLNGLWVIQAWMNGIVEMTGMHKIGEVALELESHYNSGPGVTNVVIIAESHIALHTWPEHKVVTFDMYSCDPYAPRPVIASLEEMFGITRYLKKTPIFIDRWTEADEIDHA